MNLFNFITQIKGNVEEHAKTSDLYVKLEQELLSLVSNSYQNDKQPTVSLDEKTRFCIPFHDMGNINTTHLFGLDEVIILAFYHANPHRYKKVLDLGANIGLHSVVMNKLGFDVTSFEADPDTFKVLQQNLTLNNANDVKAHNSAAGSFDGEAEFTRVCGNLTGSHLSGAKPNPYGDLEHFPVPVVNIGRIAHEFDLIKIDIEGQEADVLTSVPIEDAKKIDFMMEINGIKNAELILEYTQKAKLNIFLQSLGWARATKIEQLPLSHREGSVFISSKTGVPWK